MLARDEDAAKQRPYTDDGPFHQVVVITTDDQGRKSSRTKHLSNRQVAAFGHNNVRLDMRCDGCTTPAQWYRCPSGGRKVLIDGVNGQLSISVWDNLERLVNSVLDDADEGREPFEHLDAMSKRQMWNLSLTAQIAQSGAIAEDVLQKFRQAHPMWQVDLTGTPWMNVVQQLDEHFSSSKIRPFLPEMDVPPFWMKRPTLRTVLVKLLCEPLPVIDILDELSALFGRNFVRTV